MLYSDLLKDWEISVQELSMLTGIPAGRIYNWQKNKGKPKAEDQKVIDALPNMFIGKSIDEIRGHLKNLRKGTSMKVGDILRDMDITKEDLAVLTAIPLDEIEDYAKKNIVPTLGQYIISLQEFVMMNVTKTPEEIKQLVKEKINSASAHNKNHTTTGDDENSSLHSLREPHKLNYGKDITKDTRIQHLTSAGTLNTGYFQKLLPTDENRNAWVPFYGSLSRLLDQYPTMADLIKEKNTWPMHALPDEFMRLPHTLADFTVTYSSNNMAPRIEKGSRVSLKQIDLDMYIPGQLYMLVFTDRRYFIFEVEEGTDDILILKSMNTSTQKKLKKDKVSLIFEVKAHANPL